MYAVIDIGSNTVRLSVFSIQDGEIKPMFSRKNAAALISYIDQKGSLSDRGIRKAISVLSSFKKIIENIKIKNVYVIATASFRNISNSEQTVNAIREATGFEVNIISGEEEGTCGFIGASYNINLDSGLLVDIGGGSTEFVFYQDKKVLASYSIPIGSLSLFSGFVSGLIPKKEEYRKMKQYIREQIETIEKPETQTALLCGVGGTTRAACKLINDYFDLPLSNRSVEPRQLKKVLKDFYKNTDGGVERILRIVPDRLHTIIPGMLLLRTIAKHFCCEKIIISEYGVREGYLIKTVIGWENGEE